MMLITLLITLVNVAKSDKGERTDAKVKKKRTEERRFEVRSLQLWKMYESREQRRERRLVVYEVEGGKQEGTIKEEMRNVVKGGFCCGIILMGHFMSLNV